MTTLKYLFLPNNNEGILDLEISDNYHVFSGN